MAPNILILDGPRGVGKSTTAQAIVNALTGADVPAVYIKHVRDNADEAGNMLRRLDYCARRSTTKWVIDRFVASEWVHSTLHNRMAPGHLMRECQGVNTELVHLSALHVILSAPVETLVQRLAERGTRQMDQPLETVEPLWHAAIGIFRGCVRRVPITPGNFDSVARELVELLAPELVDEGSVA